MLSQILATTIDSSSIDLLLPLMTIGTNLQIQFDLTTHGLVLAQQFQNTDLMGNMQTGWTDFLQSGKAGVLAIGLVVGYMVRGITR
ncbi:hypothetical protein [Chamaesiphon sp. GL140_3_metabinner_50]|uniref:hypothetical protein n=1 Tax=Chamaesiphon sp. GL140_3_metabinner_50 TaxID=2970812 RepID=UPI0025FAB21E|nr:hypothetical protein [Chamaesiphon sp. GL140_3_metabinner_50]